nr:hypothetical protein [Tanacetum cinerariifolium]
MNASSKSKSVKKAKKKEEWKPTGKVFTKIGYNWRPTGWTFTLVRNACHLTRITATNKVPLREPILLEAVTQEFVATKTKGSKQSSSVSSEFASKFLILENVPPVIDEVAFMMNVKVLQEESSTQAPPLLLVPVTAILETSTIPATT